MYYTKEVLSKNEFFSKHIGSEVLDSLTNLIARKYILEYVQYLIDQNKKFALCIMDLDNFKLINDNYGHVMGDKALTILGKELSKFVGENGFVGRYGGDEFVIVYEKAVGYEPVYSFVQSIYLENGVLRRPISLGDIEPFMTATTGAASYPIDAQDYDSLFEKADKALYRGKRKGRNCYIVYVHEKHKDIKINKTNKIMLPNALQNMADIFERSDSNRNKVKNMLDVAKNYCLMSGYYYIGNDCKILSSDGNVFEVRKHLCNEFEKVMHDPKGMQELKFFHCNDLSEIVDISRPVYDFFNSRKILSFAVSKTASSDSKHGYVIFVEDRIERMWQEEDLAVLIFVSRFIGILNK